MTSGYSGTPLSKKLGIKDGMKMAVINAPFDYHLLTVGFAVTIIDTFETADDLDFIHFFTKEKSELTNVITSFKNSIKSTGMIWISWPKKASKVKTDLSGNVVREIGLAAGLVDIKVCSVDETWSAHKFVIPVKDRGV